MTAHHREDFEDNVTDGIGERIRPTAVTSGGYRDHLGRYLFAGHFVGGRSVVDLCCGHGYGSNLLLAAGARRVRGIDIAEDAIAEAARNYPGPEFAVAPVDEPLDLHDFDVAVCFEGIEHVSDPEQLLVNMRGAEVAMVSSPNAGISPEGFSGNPHHRREWTGEDFEALLSRHFAEVKLYFQWHHPDPLDLERGWRGAAKAVVPNSIKYRLGTHREPHRAPVPSLPQAGSARVTYRVHPATYLGLSRVLPGLRYGTPAHWVAVCRGGSGPGRRSPR